MVAGIIEETQEVAQHYSATLEVQEPEETTTEETVVVEGEEQQAGELEQQVEEGAEAEAKLEQQIEKAEDKGASEAEVSELKQLLRQIKHENLQLKIRLEKVEGVQKAEMGKEPEAGVLESLQTELNQIATSRGDALGTLLATMEMNPKYEDVQDVCSKENFNDIFETVAASRAEEAGTSFDEELMKAKLEVWRLPNPYKYMYEVIKQYHPKFKEVKQEKPAEQKEDKKPAKTAKEILEAADKRDKVPAKAPGSIANLPGGGGDSGAWTAAKIDQLPESELRKVPKDIYDKWLSGELE